MFDVGFSEIMMIGLVSLLVIGPERLPKVARVAGLWLGRMRAISANLKAEIHHELELEEIKRVMQQQQAQFEQQMQEQQRKLYAAQNDIESIAVEKTVQLNKSSDETR